MQGTENQLLQSLEQHLSRIEQDLGVSEKDQLTDLESSQHLSQEGYSHSDMPQSLEGNPSQMVENDEIKTSDEVSAHNQKQERTHISTSQRSHSSQQLNVQKSSSNEDNNSHSLLQLNIQPPQTSSEGTNSTRQMKSTTSIPFQMLIPILRPHLDKDRSMQLQTIFSKLRTNEISKDDFLRVIKNIVGDQMLRQAAQKLQMQLQAQTSRNPQMNPNLYSLQNQKGQKFSPHQPLVPSSAFPRQTESCFPTLGNSIQKTREVDNKSDGKTMHTCQTLSTGLNPANQERGNAMPSLQAVNKLPQHAQVPQSSFPLYGTTPSNFHSHPYPIPSIGAVPPQKLHGQVSQTRQALHAQGITPTQLGPSQLVGVAHMPKYEIQNSGNESKRIHGGSLASHMLPQQSSESSSFGIGDIEQNVQPCRMEFSTPITTIGNHTSGTAPINDGAMQISSSTPLLVSGITAKAPQKKTSIGQKKSLEAAGTSPPSSKKQKTMGAFHDQSIDQLNDVTAVSGVNLREEEEQLLCGPKEESRASEASRRVVQEEEERLVLQRGSLQKKLTEITSKCGLKSIGGDVERCLSMCVEERLRGLVSYLIKLSKQRVDSERARHRFVVTSDVGRQILSINRKIKDDWDKKQVEEAEKLRKVNDADGKMGGEAEDREKEKERDELRPKATKANKEEDDKMRTTAANVAARAAVGGDDMLSKWQLMAEQARQKRQGLDASSSWTDKTAGNKATPSFPGVEQLESERKGESKKKQGQSDRKEGGNRKASWRSPAAMQHDINVPHSISVKDVISALQREPQMATSSLLYRLHERKPAETSTL